MKAKQHMPRGVARRIMERSMQNKPFVVVPNGGAPSRCYGLDEYLKMRDQPRKHEPWKQRRASRAQADPLGAIQGTVHSTLRRDDMYE